MDPPSISNGSHRHAKLTLANFSQQQIVKIALYLYNGTFGALCRQNLRVRFFLIRYRTSIWTSPPYGMGLIDTQSPVFSQFSQHQIAKIALYLYNGNFGAPCRQNLRVRFFLIPHRAALWTPPPYGMGLIDTQSSL